MNGKLMRWSMYAAAVLASAASGFGGEPIVQDFDGWKITITPGEASLPDHVPPSPKVFPVRAASETKSPIRLVSLQHVTDVPPPPSLDATPKPAAGANELPLIVPGECFDKEGVVAVDPPAGKVDPRWMAQMYTEIYKSIPFIRAEYDANPSYIHDATLEILFGQMRPTVIQRGSMSVYHNYPDYGYGFYGYAYPPLQLVVPGTGLRIHRSSF